MELRQFWKKLRRPKAHRVSFLENSLMREAFAAREPGAIDFTHFSNEALEAIVATEAGTMRGEAARTELASRSGSILRSGLQQTAPS
jgi:hypothetical protein